MANFGATPPRAIKTFGVAGHLQEGCKIYYVSLPNTKHVGQISDLLSAQLHFELETEFSLRALILCTSFEAYWTQGKVGSVDSMTLECGIDEEKIAIGMSFNSKGVSEIKFEGIEDRVKSNQPVNAFEIYLASLYQYAHVTYLKRQLETQKLEVIALLGLPGKMDLKEFEKSHFFEKIELEKTLPATPRAQTYVELGDLNYHQLLQDESQGIQLQSSPTGEVLVKILNQALEENNNAQTVKGSSEEGSQSATIKDPSRVKLGEVAIVKSVTDHRVEEMIKISGLHAEDSDSTLTIVKGSLDENSESPSGSFGGFLKNIWPFKKKKESSMGNVLELQETLGTASENGAVFNEIQSDNLLTKEQAKEEILVYNQTENKISQEAEKVTQETVELFSHTLEKVQSEANEIKKELGSPKAKRWVDGLIGELITEKVKIKELAKKLSAVVRQKEMEYKNNERRLIEENRKKDEMIRQKNYALVRVKEQLTQTQLSLDKTQKITSKPSDDVHLKQKYSTLQKLLMASKEENARLNSRVEDMRKQLNNTQYLLKTKGLNVRADQSVIQGKYDRMTKQMEELKRINQQLSLNSNAIKNEMDKLQSENKRLKYKVDTSEKKAA